MKHVPAAAEAPSRRRSPAAGGRRARGRRRGAEVAWVAFLTLGAPAAVAQGALDRTANLDDGWTLEPGRVQFNFLHRFTVSDAPARKVTSFPTFVLAAGLPADVAFGIRYATNSEVFTGIPNEHELWLRKGIVREERGAPVDVAVTAAYNSAAQSGDGELTVARRWGPVRLVAVARVASSGYETDRTLWGAGAGAVLRVTRWLGLAADVFSLVNDEDATGDGAGFEPAWGVAAQVAIPYSPHTLSIQVVNTNTASIQGSSAGLDEVTVGFEFTIPITPARWFGGTETPPESAVVEVGRGSPADTVVVRIAELAFRPAEVRIPRGAVVRWVNEDTLEHTATSDAGVFDSGVLAPGHGRHSRRFDAAGAYPYHCAPHPFMRGVVVVE